MPHTAANASAGAGAVVHGSGRSRAAAVTAPLALIPVAPFWVVRLGASGKTYGSFPSERAADEYSAANPPVTSNFVIRVVPPEKADADV
jgi:hypothetical protein